MGKIDKITNIALIFMLAGIFLFTDFSYSLPDYSKLRPPSLFNQTVKVSQKSGTVSLDPDLTALSSQKGQGLAGILREIIEKGQFDFFNSRLRHAHIGGDYQTFPFPASGSAVGIAEIKSHWKNLIKWSLRKRIKIRQKDAFEFFMLGKSLDRKSLEEIFGESQKEGIDDFLSIGLFTLAEDGKIRMNGLSLASKKLDNGEVLYILADTPFDFENRAAPERVYIGSDSYRLLERVSKFPRISGYVGDMGSGSGIQLIAAVKQFPDIQKAIGLEIDRRALHVSLFNACLNGVGNKITVVAKVEDFKKALGNNRITFAMMNPPFMAMPDLVDVTREQKESIPKEIRVTEGKNGLHIDLRQLYSKAGWGGPDGLAITRKFFEILLPLMENNARIAVYSQFAGNIQGPTKIVEYVNSKLGLSLTFEPKVPDIVAFRIDNKLVYTQMTYVLPVEEWSLRIRMLITLEHPELDKAEYIEIAKQLEASTLESLKIQGITHFHSGYAIITCKDTPSVIANILDSPSRLVITAL